MKTKKNSVINRVLLIIIIACLALAAFFLYKHFDDINKQYQNAELALKEIDDTLKDKVDLRKNKPVVGQVIGKMKIDGLTQEMPIIEGDSLTQSMAYGVGHIPGTPLPGEKGQPVFSAHRETFFKPLENAKPGDKVLITMPYGKYTYTITHDLITGTSAEDAKKVYSTEGIKNERIGLITCYPFAEWMPPNQRITFYADIN